MTDIPPHDMDAEAAILGGIFTDPDVLDTVALELRDDHFYADANKRVYEAVIALQQAGHKADIVLVAGYLRDRNRLAQVGGQSYLAQLADATPFQAQLRPYMDIVRDKWRLRQLIATAKEATVLAYLPVENPQALLDTVEQRIGEISHQGEVKKVEAVRTVGARVIENMRAARERGDMVMGIRTGIGAFDSMTGGLFTTDLIVIAARPGLGKAQPLDAKVLTPTGFRLMGELAVGDLVYGADGMATTVTGVFERGELDVYRVELDDGGATECCEEHLWLTRTRKDRRARRPGSVKSLGDIMRSMYRGDGVGLNHSIPFVREVAGTRQTLPIDPYFLGAYLGDGCATASSVVISNPEPDVQAMLSDLVVSGDVGHVTDSGKTFRVRSAVQTAPRQHSATWKALKRLGLTGKRANEKFIPAQYLISTSSERAALLRGLCDTDGFVVNGDKGIEYTTVSPRLRDGIIELVGSLGGRWSCVPKATHYTKNGKRHPCQTAYRIVFFIPNGLVPVLSKKHRAKWNTEPHRLPERFIKSVTPVGRKVCRCIRVAAEDGLYVTDDYIVTHNTSFALSIACEMARPKRRIDDAKVLGDAVLFCTLEQPREQLVQRIAAHEGDFNSKLWRTSRLRDEDWHKLETSWFHLEHLPIFVDDKPMLTLVELRAKIRALKREIASGRAPVDSKGLKVVVVDYLQLMQGVRERNDTREREIASLSAGLKNLAKQENLCVIAISQLNRALEAQKNKRPALKDLRESGSIEQDADNVYFLYRESYYDRSATDQKLAELDIAKQRNGSTGTIELSFAQETGRFRGVAGEYDEDYFSQFDAVP